MSDQTKITESQGSTANACSVALSVWVVPGECVIVARSWRDMQAIYREHEGVSIKRTAARRVPADEDFAEVVDDEFTEPMTAGEFAAWSGRGFHCDGDC